MVTGKTRMVVDYSFNVSLVGIEALKTLSKNTSDIFEIVKIPVTSRNHLEVSFLEDNSGAISDLTIPFERAVTSILFVRNE